MEKSPGRLQILKRIEEYEEKGLFDLDVEEDPPSKVLLPKDIDYLDKKLGSKLATKLANILGAAHFDRQIRKGDLVVEKVEGLENLENLHCGAMLTCNHFNANDNYALYHAIKPAMHGRMLYKVIREGNYTAFPGLYGFLFRHCNTLPLSSNFDTMRLFYTAIDTLLKRGEKILIYPEQGMWWNYRKPRPLKSGAFRFAIKSGAPVVPCFITMRDGEKIAPDGFAIQRYTVHVCPPLYPDPALSAGANAERMKRENERIWKELYERVYGIPLTYTTKNGGGEL